MDDSTTSEAIRVSIFDQIYSLRSSKGAAHISHIAQLVDDRMRQISAHTNTFELSRIAVLAALNIADELEDLRAQREETAAPRSTAEPSPGQSATGARSTSGAHSAEVSERPQTWFEAIFDAEVPVKDRSERLSTQVSNRLQTNRQEESKPSNIAAEEDRQA